MRGAFAAYADSTGLDLSRETLKADSMIQRSLLAFPATNPRISKAIAIFNAHVWYQRSQYATHLPPDFSVAERRRRLTNRICTQALLDFGAHTSTAKRDTRPT